MGRQLGPISQYWISAVLHTAARGDARVGFWVVHLEVGDQVVVVEIMGSGQRSILRCEAANTAAGTSTILAK